MSKNQQQTQKIIEKCKCHVVCMSLSVLFSAVGHTRRCTFTACTKARQHATRCQSPSISLTICLNNIYSGCRSASNSSAFKAVLCVPSVCPAQSDRPARTRLLDSRTEYSSLQASDLRIWAEQCVGFPQTGGGEFCSRYLKMNRVIKSTSLAANLMTR